MATAVAPSPPPLAPSVRSCLFPIAVPRSEGHDYGAVLRTEPARRPSGGPGEEPLRLRAAHDRRSDLGGNLRPRGRDFELALDARIDTGRWVEVSGTVQLARGLSSSTARRQVRLTKPPTETTADTPIRVPAAPPPEVCSAPRLEAETDVPLSTNVRIQFSRDISPATFKGRITARYMQAPGGTSQPDAPIEFTTQYCPAHGCSKCASASRCSRSAPCSSI